MAALLLLICILCMTSQWDSHSKEARYKQPRRNIIGGWLTKLYNKKAEEETVAAGKKDVKSKKKFPGERRSGEAGRSQKGSRSSRLGIVNLHLLLQELPVYLSACKDTCTK